MTKDFNLLLPQKAHDAPFVPFHHVANVIATFKNMINQKTATFSTITLTLVSGNLRFRRAH